jgi:AcrR family transcriptional regulator
VRAERTKRWERRSEARPAELVKAALQCFGERGFAATRLDDVAAQAGVSKATVYLYFDNKEKLFEAVVRAAVIPSLNQAHLLVDKFEGSTSDLVRALLLLFEGALEGPFPAVAKLVISESGNFPELARLWANLVLSPAFSLVERIIARGVERGEFRRVEPAVVAPLVMAPVVMLGIFNQSIGPHTELQMDRHAILVEHAETILRGLAATNAASSAKAPRKGKR